MDTTRVPERLSLREGSEWHGNFELTELGLFFFLRVRLSRSHFSSPGAAWLLMDWEGKNLVVKHHRDQRRINSRVLKRGIGDDLK